MAARPGRVYAEIPIDAPYPRTEEFRTSAPYNEFCRLTSAALHGAMEAAPAGS
jgi:NitT/TauT family transport system ATP-binding protein